MTDLLYLVTDYMFNKLRLSAFLKNKMNAWMNEWMNDKPVKDVGRNRCLELSFKQYTPQ